MYLYDKKEKSLDVYSFDANQWVMFEYRERQMLQIPEKNRVLVAEAYSHDVGESPLFEFYANRFDETIIPMEYANSKRDELRYHFLRTGKTSKRNREILLDSYYFGHLSDRNVARLQDINKLRYFLLNKTTYSAELYNNRIKKLENIIELPESLYLLQMLEQGKFSLIGDKNISEQLDLFNISQIGELSLDELKKIDAYGITQNAYEQTLAKAENDAHVLRLIRK